MAKEKGQGGQFDRDFGYLMPFLDRVAQAGASLAPAARAELAKLIAGEKERFQRIQQLLAGAEGSASPEPQVRPAPSASKPAQSPRSKRAPADPPSARLTIGSLRNEAQPASPNKRWS